MKTKIETLIKEFGINEVESVLNQIKSKVDIRESLKKDFINLLNRCTISFGGDNIYYLKDGEWLFYYQKTNNKFVFEYETWINFESKYNLNYQELSDLVVGIVEDVLNYKI